MGEGGREGGGHLEEWSEGMTFPSSEVKDDHRDGVTVSVPTYNKFYNPEGLWPSVDMRLMTKRALAKIRIRQCNTRNIPWRLPL